MTPPDAPTPPPAPPPFGEDLLDRLPDGAVTWTAVRAQGAGGQNVNKVSSAVHLRFSLPASGLDEAWLDRLRARAKAYLADQESVILIKAQRHRSQDMNRQDALARLGALLEAARVPPKTRRPTKPSRGSIQRRLAGKAHTARTKAGRRPVGDDG